MNKKLQVNRRGFLKSSLLGTAGALVSTTALATQHPSKDIEPVIIRRKLGKTGIELPIVSFGVMWSDNPSLVKSAFQKGFVHFDTAHGYQEGRNETMLGELFKEFPRESFILATKVAPDDVNRETGELGPGYGCDVKCVKGFPVRDRIADVSRLAGVPRDLIASL